MSVDRRDQCAPAVGAVGNSFDSADYELRWPAQLVAREMAALRVGGKVRERREQIEFLLEEVFLGDVPVLDFAAASRPQVLSDPWGVEPSGASGDEDANAFLDRLMMYLPALHEHHEPAPYWPARHGKSRAGALKTTAAQRFAAMIGDLHKRGYFGRSLPLTCVDDYEGVNESDVLAERLQVPDLWPLKPDTWDDGTFYGLIEVFHDLAVRPRSRMHHDYSGCGWHYDSFSIDTGRALYRWRVNQLLGWADLPLRLAEAGEDKGRLVRVVDDGRAALLERALQSSDRGVTERVSHAVAQFRARAATEHSKRSAVLTLTGILEERRELIRDKIGKKDEGALFTIANEFAIRHQRRGQQGDYDAIFLDWIFWWYLGTIELTEQLLARTDVSSAS
jgi:hypothetical protein